MKFPYCARPRALAATFMNKLVLKKAETVLFELRKFSPDICYLGNQIKDDRIEVFERNYKINLPADFKFILRQYNSFSVFGTEVYGFGPDLMGESIEQVYKFEHFEVAGPMFKELLPFSPDGFGNHYCLDLSRLYHEVCPIIFWQHDIEYDSFAPIESCNNSFSDWVQEVMIDWTLEEINYDGTPCDNS